MSRSGYSDDCENVAMWRGQVASAVRGKRGQRFFRELVTALDAMSVKRLVANELQTAGGEVCALGSLAKYKGATLEPDDTYDYEKLGETFDIARQLAQETMYENDDGFHGSWNGRERERETPEHRWDRMRNWATDRIRVTPDELEDASDIPDEPTDAPGASTVEPTP